MKHTCDSHATANHRTLDTIAQRIHKIVVAKFVTGIVSIHGTNSCCPPVRLHSYTLNITPPHFTHPTWQAGRHKWALKTTDTPPPANTSRSSGHTSQSLHLQILLLHMYCPPAIPKLVTMVTAYQGNYKSFVHYL